MNSIGICSQSPKNALKPNEECFSSTDCQYEGGGGFGECRCGLGIN